MKKSNTDDVELMRTASSFSHPQSKSGVILEMFPVTDRNFCKIHLHILNVFLIQHRMQMYFHYDSDQVC